MSESVRTPFTYISPAIGVVTVYLIAPHVVVAILGSCLLILVTTILFIRMTTFSRHTPDPQRVAELTSAIHEAVRDLVCRGYTKLRPVDINTSTAYIHVGMVGGSVTIRRVNWDEYHGMAPPREFVIGLEGVVVRRSNDDHWRQAPLVRQLEELLDDVRHHYIPRMEVSRVR